MSMGVGVSVLLLIVTSVHATPCSQDGPLDALLPAVGAASNEADLTRRGNCVAVSNATHEEECLCAAFRLGWHSAARAGLRQRLLRKQPAPAMRKLAQSAFDAMQVVLARMHSQYPRHLKFVPALEFAQTDDIISVRVRHARYARGAPLFVAVEGVNLRFSDTELFYAAEGGEHPGYVETTLNWRHPLKRRDGCADRDELCAKWASEGRLADACKEMPSKESTPSFRERCPLSCGTCPDANGISGVESAWAAVPGGLLFEARKAKPGRWERLLADRNAINRVGEAPAAPPVGALLECVEACDAEVCSNYASSGPSSLGAIASRLWHQAAPAEDSDVARASRQCREECGEGCETDMSSEFTIS